MVRSWQLCVNVRLWLAVSLLGCLSSLAAQPGWAGERSNPQRSHQARELLQSVDYFKPKQNTEAQIIPITGIQVNPTESGVEVILQTPFGEKLEVSDRSNGNNFIADIEGAQLQLPDGKPFRSLNPAAGISEIVIINLDDKTIQVTVVGETALPQVELFDSKEGLILGLTPLNPPLTRGESNPLPLSRGEPEGGQTVTIDRVQLNPTETGFEILLLTPTGTAQQLRVVNVSQENNFIAEIQGAQINLPNAQPFRAENPIEGVSEVTVTNQNENTVLVTVVGEEKQPMVELFDSEEGLIFSATSSEQTAQEEDIELVVTGEQNGYRVPNASTATRTDTPIRDIPQSIQVVPRQVLEDRGVRRELEALETVSGVVDIQANLFDVGGVVNIRGFQSNTRLRNGLASEGIFYIAPIPIGTVEQVEVLKGPASVLFGAVEPGGVVNYVTRQPLSEPYYRIGFEAGNYGLYQPNIDLSGPLTQDKSVLYRLIASYQGGGNYKDEVPVNNQRISIALFVIQIMMFHCQSFPSFHSVLFGLINPMEFTFKIKLPSAII